MHDNCLRDWTTNNKYSLLPRVTWRNYASFKKINWELIDAKIEKKLGLRGTAIPSIRVGIYWILEYLGYTKAEDHVLIPKYLSRCIINAINRYAFPVVELTSQSKMVLIVNEFALKQSVNQKEFATRDLIRIEDSPYGISYSEEIGSCPYVKLIGFPKLLPILKGAFFMSNDQDLLSFIKTKRGGKNVLGCSWFIYAITSHLRSKGQNVAHSILAELAYEMYIYSPRDNSLLLNNFWSGLDLIDKYEEETVRRIGLAKKILGERLVYPDADRLACVLLMPTAEKITRFKEAFERNSFISEVYHFDINRDILNPNYQNVHLIPLNPNIPIKNFQNLLEEINLML